jgi:GNAT superfamily N-acetyltransferase
MKLIRYTERPELWARTDEISHEVWPEYNQHGAVMNAYWERLFEDFPAYQFVLYEDDVLGEGHTIPCEWDGTPRGLGEGIDAMVIAAFEAHAAGRPPNALCALAAEIRPRFQGRGLASRVIDAMADVARDAGLAHLIAPGDGAYTFPGGLAPVEIDRDADTGAYWEPNVWIVHPLENS